MLDFINTLIGEITKQFPEWDSQITKILSDDNEADESNKNIISAFTNMLKQFVEKVKGGEISETEICDYLAQYSCNEYAVRYIKRSLDKYRRFEPLRKLEREDIYKAKNCIDQIWTSYVLRHNPYFEEENNLLLTAQEYRDVAREIDNNTDICIGYNLHVKAISRHFIKETELSSELCEYIAAKIDADFDKLKLNYIIYKLRNIEDMLDEE